MKRLPALAVIGIVLSAVCYAKHCPDPRLQQAVIGGDTINGNVRLHDKPLKFAQLRLFFSNGKTAWVGTTGKDGGFQIRDLRPDTYRLVVRGWGSTTIRVIPEQKTFTGQAFVDLMDTECTATVTVTN
jgi:hypothetical protein